MRLKANATWQGDLKIGNGTFSTESGSLKGFIHFFDSWTKKVPLTNPDERLAAAHASRYLTALVDELRESGVQDGEIEVGVTVDLEKKEGRWSIEHIHVRIQSPLADMDQGLFLLAANRAKKSYLSFFRLLKIPTTLDVTVAQPGVEL